MQKIGECISTGIGALYDGIMLYGMLLPDVCFLFVCLFVYLFTGAYKYLFHCSSNQSVRLTFGDFPTSYRHLVFNVQSYA